VLAPAAAGPVLELVEVVHRCCFCFFILRKVFALPLLLFFLRPLSVA
jgi:hypothetical protein